MTTGINAMIRLNVSPPSKAASCTTKTSQSQSPKAAGLSMVHFFQSAFHIFFPALSKRHFTLSRSGASRSDHNVALPQDRLALSIRVVEGIQGPIRAELNLRGAVGAVRRTANRAAPT